MYCSAKFYFLVFSSLLLLTTLAFLNFFFPPLPYATWLCGGLPASGRALFSCDRQSQSPLSGHLILPCREKVAALGRRRGSWGLPGLLLAYSLVGNTATGDSFSIRGVGICGPPGPRVCSDFRDDGQIRPWGDGHPGHLTGSGGSRVRQVGRPENYAPSLAT